MRHYIIIFLFSLVLSLPLLYPDHAESAISEPLPIEEQRAHDFFSYLVKLGVIDIETKIECDQGRIIPATTAYAHQACKSILRVDYNCGNTKESYTAETRIDWHYISKMQLSGYSRNGEEIEISGNITVLHAKTKHTKTNKAYKGTNTRQAKLTFDSSITAKRAFNAFTLLKNKCDTSANYPF